MRLTIPGLAAAGLLVAGCARVVVASGPRVEATETLEVEVGTATSLSVETKAGEVTADPAAGAALVRVVARKNAASEADMERIRVFARTEGDQIRVGYEAEGVEEGVGVAFAVEAPRGLHLRLRTSAGAIRATGFGSGLDARTSAGEIAARDVRGDLALETSAGSIEAHGAEGCVRARTSAGSVRVSGNLRGGSALQTSAGSVEAAVPATCLLQVSGSTNAGGVDCAYEGSIQQTGSQGSLRATIGDGSGGSLTLQTNAGSVSLRKSP